MLLNMIINIDEKYLIDSDSHCWILKKRLQIPIKKGNRIYKFKEIGYYHSLESVVKNFADMKIRLIPDSDVSKIIRKIDKIRNDLTEVLRPYKIEIL